MLGIQNGRFLEGRAASFSSPFLLHLEATVSLLDTKTSQRCVCCTLLTFFVLTFVPHRCQARMSHQTIPRENGDAIPKRRPECNMWADDLRLQEHRRESILAAPAWQQHRQRPVGSWPPQRLGPSSCLCGHIHRNWKVPQNFTVDPLQ